MIKRLVQYTKGGGGVPAKNSGERMGEKRFKSSNAAGNLMMSCFVSYE
jgi:hypothetical protein